MDCGEKVASVIYTDDGLYIGMNIRLESFQTPTFYFGALIHFYGMNNDFLF